MRKKGVHMLFLILSVVGSGIVLGGSPAANAAVQVPPQLAGTWSISVEGGVQHLTLADSQFLFFSPTFPDVPSMGNVAVSGDTITFYASNRCNGTGTYEWSLSDGGLTFVQVPGSNDPCRRAVFLTVGTWTRGGSL